MSASNGPGRDVDVAESIRARDIMAANGGAGSVAAQLERAAKELTQTSLRDLLEDPSRCDELRAEAEGILFDFSRQRVTRQVCARERVPPHGCSAGPLVLTTRMRTHARDASRLWRCSLI
jgi:hypothetical protein